MRPLWGFAPACALLCLAADAGPAKAAWNNVFQVCCHSCQNKAAVSNYYAPPATGYVSASNYGPDACTSCAPPPPVCTTRYVQRSYYQPVTTYQSRSYYEAVTTYRTSYYYEPVTSYRYSCYYDPCSGCPQQVATPVTSYSLRSQACPVQSWVQRCAQVPVTSYRIASYWEPQTSCCQPAAPACPPAAPCCPTASTGACPSQPVPAGPPPGAPAPPGVSEQRLTPTPGVQEAPEKSYDRQFDPRPSNRQPTLAPPVRPVTIPTSPSVRLDRIVSLPQSSVEGQVIRDSNVPRSGARLVFVSTSPQIDRQLVTSDATGKFRVNLASGGWLVYVNGSDNRPVFHSRINLADNEARQVLLVSQ